MKRFSSIVTTLILLAILATNVMAAPAADSSTASFKVTNVVPNSYVTIQTFGFPLDTDIQVFMTPFPSLGIGSALVAGFNTGSNESGTYRFEIAASVRGYARVSIRLEDSDFSLVRVFNNVAGGTSTATGTTTTTTIPTISIVSVVVDDTVTIKTHNFPANRTFNVLMGEIGTHGIDGIKVDSIDSGSGASTQYTFDIPDSLKGDSKIAIRLESTTGGFFAFNWFFNKTGTTSTPVTPAAIPTFSIVSVVKDSKVTIRTSNFPANDSFKVYMGKFGTLGIGGVQVDTISSGSGGTMEFTFTVPDSLKGQNRIAIRTVSPTSGFFSFNWFWNNTFP